MKRIVILILISMIHTGTKSQDLDNLDKKMGFNKFKLESSYEVYKLKLTYVMTGSDKVKYYKYSDTDIFSVFGVTIEKINLGFYKDKLYTISIDFLNTDSDGKKIQNELQELFGRQGIQYNRNSGEFEYDWVMKWDAKNVYLQLDKLSCSGKIHPCSLELFMISKKIRAEIKNDSF